MIRGIGLGFSLVLVAAGAVLAWAVTATSKNIDIEVTGYILLGVGVFGFVVWAINSIVYRWAVKTGRFRPNPPHGV